MTQGGVFQQHGADEVGPRARDRRGGAAAHGVADDDRTPDSVVDEDLQEVDEIIPVDFPDSAAQFSLGEPLGLAVPAGVPREDPVVGLPATDRVRPTAAGIGETVKEEQRRGARVIAAEPVEAEVLTGVRGWHT